MRTSPRRRAREFVLQGLYQRQLSGNAGDAIRAQLAEAGGFAKADEAYFDVLWVGVTAEYESLVALGAVIRGETYHFEIVANESARGISELALEFGIPIGNGILTTDTDEQALMRCEKKGVEAVQAALELANLLEAIDAD